MGNPRVTNEELAGVKWTVRPRGPGRVELELRAPGFKLDVVLDPRTWPPRTAAGLLEEAARRMREGK